MTDNTPKKKAVKKQKAAQEASPEKASSSMLDQAKGLFNQFLEKLKTDRMTQIITGGAVVVIIGGYFLVGSLFKEDKGGWKYAVCKVVAERYVRYPISVDVLAAGEKANSALVYFSKRNAFGDERLHLLECVYGKDQNGIFLKSATLDDRPMDPDFLKGLSDTLPAILAHQEDFFLELPEGFSLKMEKFKDRNPVPLDRVYIRSRF